MTIRTRLYAAALFPVVCGAVVVSVVILSLVRLNHAVTTSRMAGEIVQGAFDLNMLMHDYARHGHERAKEQWLGRHAQLGAILEQVSFQGDESRRLLEQIRAAQGRAKRIFLEMGELTQRAPDPARESLDREWAERLSGQLTVEVGEMISLASRLDESRRVRLVRLHDSAAVVMVLCIVLMALGTGGTALLMGHSILRPIRSLRDGMDVVGQGNLDYRVGGAGEDEIGGLAKAFDRMTERLAAITASRDLLNREMQERRKAERSLELTLKELARSNRELEQFAYVASHDLQEPLRIVSSYGQLLQRRYKGHLDKDADDFIAYMVDGAHRMQALIRDLLAFSRVGASDAPLRPVNPSLVLDRTMGNLRMTIEDAGASVERGILPGEVLGDEGQLVQLFQNLIGNAIKFRGKEPVRVSVGAEPLEPGQRPWAGREPGEADGKDKETDVMPGYVQWLFSVRDNGIGIDAPHLVRIFGLFQRLNHKDEYPGTGMGLAICKRIVDRHGGHIWAESEAGHGSCFRFVLWGSAAGHARLP